MSIADREVDLSAEESEIVGAVHRFAADVMRPIGRQLDTMTPEEVIAADSPLWKVYERYRELGIEDVRAGSTGLSPERQARLQCLSLIHI